MSAIHFRDRFIRQVSCYTLLSGFRLPWPPSCCLYESTPFLGSSWVLPLGTLTLKRLVHPTSPVLLTRCGPLVICVIYFSLSSYFAWVNTNLLLPIKSLRISQGMSFPNKKKTNCFFRSSNHSLYMIKLFFIYKPQQSWGKIRREPATRWFDESFAPILRSDEQFAR